MVRSLVDPNLRESSLGPCLLGPPNISRHDHISKYVRQMSTACHTRVRDTSIIIAALFTRRRDVDPVDWPPNSPDMNPFQNLWAAVKRILRSNWAEQPPVRTPEELWDRVLDA
ncbi:hypothetical protein ANN_15191 [Periplaneta americana]|uniref:Uncharacterized protein n=1 Tax=Periplaneta americana TaxID=6978 RepID=A0ABQ8SGD3_PERAM|nr:hypothetical protein ANN_15191 [Periplaneta americana]